MEAEQYDEDELVEEPEEEPEELDEAASNDGIEEKALKMGWVPKEEFKGNPDLWRSAEEFVDRGEKMIPILNRKIRDLEKRQQAKDKAFAEYLNDMRNKLHAQRVQEHEIRKQQAVADGDTDAYNRLSIESPQNDLPEYKPPEQQNDPVFDEWLIDNPWYHTEYEQNQEAENYGRFLRSARPDLEGRDFLDEVSKHVRKKFQNPNRNKPTAVDGETRKANKVAGKLYNTLDEDAKAAFNSFVREGIFKNTVEDREAYAKDVLS